MIKNFSDYMDIQEMVPSDTKKQLKRQRERKYKRKLRRIALGYHRCMPPAFPIGLNRKYVEEGEEGGVRYKRSYSPRSGKRKILGIRSRYGNLCCFRCAWLL